MRSPEDFPADILDAAAELAYAWAMPDETAYRGARGAIARALMERDRAATERAAKMEQERCAKIAASFAWRTELALEIAAAIRGELEGATADAAAIRSQP
jgi:hypothetical protein